VDEPAAASTPPPAADAPPPAPTPPVPTQGPIRNPLFRRSQRL
jgi:hypothetical protein